MVLRFFAAPRMTIEADFSFVLKITIEIRITIEKGFAFVSRVIIEEGSLCLLPE